MEKTGITAVGGSLAEDYQAFIAKWPAWKKTALLDELRKREYGRLDADHQIYLDYTGAGLYGDCQLRDHFEVLSRGVFGNPHSSNPTSAATTARVERARRSVLEFFNASEDEYFAIFTANASAALKLVGESYPFGPDGRYLLTFDNHNSVNGIREFARTRGAEVTYVPIEPAELRLDRAALSAELKRRGNGDHLFAYPAQSNFSGVQHPLEIIGEAHAAGWDVLLDAAAFVPSNRLDLSKWKPDFVSISFYKMFGYPTGVGCLLMRRPMMARLHRPWFAGGTIRIASVQAGSHYMAADAAAFEDGTVDYLDLFGVDIGLRHVASIGIDLIHDRVRCLAGWLIGALSSLHHSNGRPLTVIHGPANVENRGATIALSFLDVNGVPLDIRRVQDLATEARISIRTGCFCNPGAGEVAFGLSPAEIGEFFKTASGLDFDELRQLIRAKYGKEIGAIRVSAGIAANFADVHRFVEFARQFLDRTVDQIGLIDHGELRPVRRDTA